LVPGLAAVALLVPNIQHIVAYKVPTVFNNAEVRDLVTLDKKASEKDYTIAWWDYGYPIWFYSDTSTLIDGGKHDEDNFIVSKILQTDSPELAANLARLAVERYANDPRHRKVAPEIFKGKDPNTVLAELEASDYPLPPKTREVYLYLPLRMMGIFPTVALFGNLDLSNGSALRKIEFYPLRPVGQKGTTLQLSNGLQIDIKKGELLSRGGRIPLRRLVVASLEKNMKIRVGEQNYHLQGRYSVVYLKSYGKIVLMDNATYRSTYVQMFMLGRYDPKLFEPVVLSPYTRIYRLKK
jgi:dolichyl-diphosphooligosaccharide--protein glycosyltransferase/undecaprenyl-diphosphooligosaccharide--protein glycosyltransferase